MTRAFDLSVYGILDPELSRGRDLAALADAAVKGGATFLQLRNKRGTTREMVAQARAILDVTSGTSVRPGDQRPGRRGARRRRRRRPYRQ